VLRRGLHDSARLTGVLLLTTCGEKLPAETVATCEPDALPWRVALTLEHMFGILGSSHEPRAPA
jgi:hypothetical protein